VQSVSGVIVAQSHRPGLIYHFTVLDSTTINAFALPGDYIYITRGLLACLNSGAELAAVPGHEIGLVTARHSGRQHSTATVTGILDAVVAASTGIQGTDTLASLASTAIVRGYGRGHELEADRRGAEYIAKAGYDPQGMPEVVGILKNQEAFDRLVAAKEGREPIAYHGLFSTHPDTDARFREVVDAAAKFRSTKAARVDREIFLFSLDGLTFGERDEEGIVRNNHYYHKDLDISVTLPEGWHIDNNPEWILALTKDEDGIIQVTVTDLDKRITPELFMTGRVKLRNMQHGEPVTIGDFNSYTAIADGKTPYGVRPVRYVVIYRGTRAWIIAGAAKDKHDPQQYDAAILATARSIHPHTAEQPLAEERHLEIIRAPAGTCHAALAEESPDTNFPEEQLRLLNNNYPDGGPETGSLLKIVR